MSVLADERSDSLVSEFISSIFSIDSILAYSPTVQTVL